MGDPYYQESQNHQNQGLRRRKKVVGGGNHNKMVEFSQQPIFRTLPLPHQTLNEKYTATTTSNPTTNNSSPPPHHHPDSSGSSPTEVSLRKSARRAEEVECELETLEDLAFTLQSLDITPPSSPTHLTTQSARNTLSTHNTNNNTMLSSDMMGGSDEIDFDEFLASLEA